MSYHFSMFRLLALLLSVMLAPVMSPALPGQADDSATRDLISSLVVARKGFPQMDRRGAGTPRIIERCVGYPTDHRKLLEAHEVSSARFRQLNSPDREATWDLICLRSMLYAIDAPGTGGGGVPPGTAWIRAALGPLTSWLNDHPADRTMAGMLAVLLLDGARGRLPAWRDMVNDRRDSITWIDIPGIGPLLYRSVNAAVEDSVVWRACTATAIAMMKEVMARDCSTRALAAGADSTWHLLRISWKSLITFDTATGLTAFNLAAIAARDPAARSDFAWHLESPVENVVRNCPACWGNGVINGYGFTGPMAVYGEYRLSEEERFEVLRLASEDLPDWIDATAARHHAVKRQLRISLPLSYREDQRKLFSDARPQIQNLLAHALTTAHAAGTFRACITVADPLVPACLNRPPSGTPEPLGVRVQSQQLWLLDGSRHRLTTYALPIDELDLNEEQGTLTGEVKISLRWWSLDRAGQWDTTVTRSIAAPRNALKNGWLTGVIDHADTGHDRWLLTAVQPNGRTGGAMQDGVEPLSEKPLALSDLFIGAAGQRLQWVGDDGEPILLAPMRGVSRDESLSAFWQVRSTEADSAVLSLRLSPLESDGALREKGQGVEVTTRVSVGRELTRFDRELNVAHLDRGLYRLEVVVTLDGGSSAARSTVLSIY